MILGIGLDLVTVDRIARWLPDEGLCGRYFHEEEMAAVRGRGKAAAWSLAARFAAKEAYAKALGTGFAGLRLRDIRVGSERSGRPVLVLEGTARAAAEALGARRFHVSLTHEGGMAAAQVILED